jgi:hypothetical protein
MTKVDKNCKKCNESFKVDTRELNRGNGKYCSLSCAAKTSKLQKYEKICKHCGTQYYTASKFSKYCSSHCKQRNYRLKSKGAFNMKAFYKLFKNLPCELCGWKEASRDLHHIIPVSSGGKNETNNLISVCPNHHRMIHKNLISKDTLLKCVEYRTISSS